MKIPRTGEIYNLKYGIYSGFHLVVPPNTDVKIVERRSKGHEILLRLIDHTYQNFKFIQTPTKSFLYAAGVK